LEVLNERVDIAEVLAKQVLFLFLRSYVLFGCPAIFAAGCATWSVGRVSKLGWTSSRADHGDLRHEVEVEKLKKLDFDPLGRVFILEQACNGQQAVHVLKCPCVLRGRQEGRDEDEEGLRLYCRAVVGVEEVEEEVHVDFTTEDDARRRVEEQ